MAFDCIKSNDDVETGTLGKRSNIQIEKHFSELSQFHCYLRINVREKFNPLFVRVWFDLSQKIFPIA